MLLRQALAEAFESCIATGRCRALDIVHQAQRQHPELFSRSAERLIMQAALREAKTLMRAQASLTHEDTTTPNQPELLLGILPGLRPPLALAIPITEGEYEYVRYDAATWTDLEAALQERTMNVERAIARKQDHILKMDALRQYLCGFAGRTVAEACALMEKDREDC